MTEKFTGKNPGTREKIPGKNPGKKFQEIGILHNSQDYNFA